MHAQQRLAGRAERVGEVQLGHHHALEQVGRLADHDRVDVVEPRSASASARSIASRHRPGDRHVLALGPVVGLADADDGGRLLAHHQPVLPARTRGSAAGPGRWSRGRARGRRSPSQTRCAASPIRIRPPVNIGLPASAPPDGLIATSSPRPSSRRRISSWWLNGACSSATSTPVERPTRPRPRAGRGRAGQVADAEAERVDAWAMPGIQAGRSHSVARPVARGQHDRGGAVGDRRAVVLAQRVGVHRPGEQLLDRRAALADGVLVLLGVGQRAVRRPRPSPARPRARRRAERGPAARRATRCRARAASACTGRAAAPGCGAGRRPTTCRSRRPARCRPRRSGSSPRPRRAPTRRPSRRASR